MSNEHDEKWSVNIHLKRDGFNEMPRTSHACGGLSHADALRIFQDTVSAYQAALRHEPILHELQMQNESTGERRAFIVEPHHPGQASLRVRLEDGRYAITGIRHVRIIKERIVDAEE